MAVTVREINGAELEEIIEKGKVLVDFYSKTCGPCKMLSFVLKDVAKGIDATEIVMLDYDVNKEAVEKYGVGGYPTMIYFEDGQEVERMKGLQQKPAILRMIKA
ncbi:thioredoxin family protein [Desulforamulus aquiferis]|uniref:Thioredoxin n=1 Tax=Desulforamulus aquiferis TaxID=1397668 RepID=A0AAW7Z9N1_9FIRM|nr:thioredoxin domain-containing protein [Desulforamulus aquiferis]MDO7785979.1 thioredoxin domain-containing protein [Desulforamulus aquiferis]RYD02000.1 thiol-disulfide isomerase [Desulforamulus aquiferis]